MTTSRRVALEKAGLVNLSKLMDLNQVQEEESHAQLLYDMTSFYCEQQKSLGLEEKKARREEEDHANSNEEEEHHRHHHDDDSGEAEWKQSHDASSAAQSPVWDHLLHRSRMRRVKSREMLQKRRHEIKALRQTKMRSSGTLGEDYPPTTTTSSWKGLDDEDDDDEDCGHAEDQKEWHHKEVEDRRRTSSMTGLGALEKVPSYLEGLLCRNFDDSYDDDDEEEEEEDEDEESEALDAKAREKEKEKKERRKQRLYEAIKEKVMRGEAVGYETLERVPSYLECLGGSEEEDEEDEDNSSEESEIESPYYPSAESESEEEKCEFTMRRRKEAITEDAEHHHHPYEPSIDA